MYSPYTCTQMGGMSAEAQARKAILSMLKRIRDDGIIGYHIGLLSNTFELLTEAYATLTGDSVEAVRSCWECRFPTAPRALAEPCTQIDPAAPPAVTTINFDPNLTMCGRVADYLVRLTFGLWDYRKSITVRVGVNRSGLTVIESAIERAYENLPIVGADYARIVMTNQAGDTIDVDDDEDKGEYWLAKMLISSEIISIEPKQKPDADSPAVRESEIRTEGAQDAPSY